MTDIQNNIDTLPPAEPKNKKPTYQDLLKISFGDMVISKLPSAPKCTFGKSDREMHRKLYINQNIAQIDNIGRYGKGSAAYFPSTVTMVENDKTIKKAKDNPTDKFRFPQLSNIKIGTSERHNQISIQYDYMKIKQDHLNINDADLVRRYSLGNVRMGIEPRWKSEKKDKVTPGPIYDVRTKLEVSSPLKYSFGKRIELKHQNCFKDVVSTNPIVGPGTYSPIKQSKSAILRFPTDSKIQSSPSVSFSKAPKYINEPKKQIHETYQTKFGTISAVYAFQYSGEGHTPIKNWQKPSISNPIEKNKIKSFSMGKAAKEQKRGISSKDIINPQSPVRIQHPHL